MYIRNINRAMGGYPVCTCVRCKVFKVFLSATWGPHETHIMKHIYGQLGQSYGPEAVLIIGVGWIMH